MSVERSGSGQPVYRHEQSAELSISSGDPALMQAVDAHLVKHVGEPSTVFHELVSLYVHVDVHVVAPSDDRPVFTLMTSGMSERPMHAPSGEELHAELMMVLPPTWPAIDSVEFSSPDAHWPYGLLQDLARLPHEFQTALWDGHTVPNGDPPQPYAPSTALCGALLAPPLITRDGFESFQHAGHDVAVFAVVPLHADEMQLKLDNGLDALHDLLDEAALTEVLDPDRPTVAPARRSRFGRFRRS